MNEGVLFPLVLTPQCFIFFELCLDLDQSMMDFILVSFPDFHLSYRSLGHGSEERQKADDQGLTDRTLSKYYSFGHFSDAGSEVIAMTSVHEPLG